MAIRRWCNSSRMRALVTTKDDANAKIGIVPLRGRCRAGGRLATDHGPLTANNQLEGLL
jgi:hypothetical protein